MITSRQSIETEIVIVLASQPGLTDPDLAETVAANLGAEPFGVAEVIAELRARPKAA